MDCPNCKNEPMVVLELHEIEVDHCLSCKGIWLDSGELETLIAREKGKDALLESFKEAENPKEQKRKCPICGKKMQKVWVGDQDVMIDRCRDEHGIWFDMGELEEIIKIAGIGENSHVLALVKDLFGK